jgi:two-component sensor histidine kinase
MNAKTGIASTTYAGKGSAATGQFTRSNLRYEVARLRQMVAHSEETVSRYAMMIREGDHRIKNSLQIVASLMGVQAAHKSSKSIREALLAASARIQSIADIHNALQITGGEDLVDLGAVLRTMCRSMHAMAGDPRSVAVDVDVEPIQVPFAIAQPIVLAVNELIINALRHAFPANRRGTVQVSAGQADGWLRVVVADDGAGLPAGYAEGSGYGMTLVRMMATQIDGELNIENNSGTRFTLTAPTLRDLTSDALEKRSGHNFRNADRQLKRGAP